MSRFRRLWTAIPLGLILVLPVLADEGTEAVSTAPAGPAYEQIATIDLTHGEQIVLNTFCMDPQGRLLVAVGGQQRTVSIVDGERQIETVEQGNAIRVYNLDGDLQATWEMPFAPQSVNVSPDGSIFAAGAGTIARLSADGEIVQQAATPQVGNMEEYKAQIREQLENQYRDRAALLEQQIEQAREIVARLEEKSEDDRTAIDKLRLKNAQRQLEILEQNIDIEGVSAADINVDTYLSYKLKVPGLAVTDQDVFVAVSSLTGYGYDVWRMNHSFEEPTQIVTELRGCCGQMDIQCCNGELYVAENSRHRVCRYDRDGELICSWGSGDRTGEDGFSGCCNPMNLRFGRDGEVLTAESGSGDIKRYSCDGEFLGRLGNADLVGGCKHVAIAATEDGSRVFMLDVPRLKIAVLAPIESSDGQTPEPAAGG